MKQPASQEARQPARQPASFDLFHEDVMIINVFRITGPLGVESTSRSQKVTDVELGASLLLIWASCWKKVIRTLMWRQHEILIDPPSWQEAPVLPAMQLVVQCPETSSQGPRQLHSSWHPGPQWLLSHSVKWVIILSTHQLSCHFEIHINSTHDNENQFKWLYFFSPKFLALF